MNYFGQWRKITNKSLDLIARRNLNEYYGGEWQKYRGKKLVVNEAKILSQFRSAQLTAVKMAEAWGATPILLIQPSRILGLQLTDDLIARRFIDNLKYSWGLSLEEYQSIYKKVLQEVRFIAKESSISIVDLAKGIPPSPKYFLDSVHVNTKGSRLEASLIAKTLEKIICKRLDTERKLRCSVPLRETH